MGDFRTEMLSENKNKISRDSNSASYIYQSMKQNQGRYIIAYIKCCVLNFILGYAMYSILGRVHYDTKYLSLVLDFYIGSFTYLVFLSDFRQIHQKTGVPIKHILTHIPVYLFKPCIIISICLVVAFFVGFMNWVFAVIIIATGCLLLPYCILLMFYLIDENKNYTFRNDEFQRKIHNQNGFVFKTILWIIFQKKWRLVQIVLLFGLYYFLNTFIDPSYALSNYMPFINGVLFVYTFILCCHVYVFTILTLNDLYNAIFHMDNLICKESEEQ